MSDARYTLDVDLAEKLFKIANLQADSQLKMAQRAFLPWQFMVSALAVAFTAGAGLTAALYTVLRFKVGG